MRAKPLVRANVVKRYADGFSLRECADFFDCSLERVRQIVRADRPDLIRAPFRGMNMDPRERLAVVRHLAKSNGG